MSAILRFFLSLLALVFSTCGFAQTAAEGTAFAYRLPPIPSPTIYYGFYKQPSSQAECDAIRAGHKWNLFKVEPIPNGWFPETWTGIFFAEPANMQFNSATLECSETRSIVREDFLGPDFWTLYVFSLYQDPWVSGYSNVYRSASTY